MSRRTATTRRAGAFALAPLALMFAATSLNPSELVVDAPYVGDKAPVLVTDPTVETVAPITPDVDPDADTDAVETAPETTTPAPEPVPETTAPVAEPETAPETTTPAPEPVPETTAPAPETTAPASGGVAAPPTSARPGGAQAGAADLDAGPRMIDQPVARPD